MTNESFLKVALDERSNSFFAQSFVSLYGRTYGCRFKIDTGCSATTIPFRKISNMPEFMTKQYKHKAIDAGMTYIRSYGVSDDENTRKRDKELVDQGDLLECSALKFLHQNVPLNIGGYSFSSDVYVNYERVGNPLIGMDILKKFHFFCDRSRETGEFMFVGCLRDQADKTDFLSFVYNHFGYQIT